MPQLTVIEAAARLGVSRYRIWQLVKAGRLPAVKLGRDWLIEDRDLELVAKRAGPGRPRKQPKP